MAAFRADALHDQRVRCNLSMSQVAVLAGLSPETVRRAELGLTVPSGRTVRKLAQALGVDVEALAPSGQGPPTLTDVRHRIGLQQRDIARRVQVTVQMVSKVEAGVYGVRKPQRWAKAYGLSVEAWVAAWNAAREAGKRQAQQTMGGSNAEGQNACRNGSD